MNLLVIRSDDIDRLVTFYEAVGLSFHKHSHGSGPEHYACERDGFVFEIYSRSEKQQPTVSVRLGFSVDDVDVVVETLVHSGAKVVSGPRDSEWGRRAVVKDIDGHTVELVEPNKREQVAAQNP